MFHLYNKHRKTPSSSFITRLLVAFALLVVTGNLARAQSPLSGTYYVGGTGSPSYSTLAAAITDLNTNGVSGAVTIKIAAGYTETAPSSSGYVLGSATLNASLSSSNTLTFVKDGSGANPTFTAATGGTATVATTASALDGIFVLAGADYVTLDGMNFQENASNTAAAGWMEFGIGFLKLSATDGCQYNTVKNCVVTLTKSYNASGAGVAGDGATAIWFGNTLQSNNVALTGVTSTGANSYNTIKNNTIQLCNTGIMLYGFADATAPYSNYDQGNNIGGTPASGATTGNSIVNFGGGATTAPAVGIRSYYNNGLVIANNTINNNNGSGTNHASTLRAIFLQTALNANATIQYNTITVKGGGTTTATAWIESTAGASGTNNTIDIRYNTFTNSSNGSATSGVWNGIYTQGAAYNLKISGNNFTSNSTACTSGSFYGIYNTGAIVNSINIDSNTINGVTFSATTTTATVYFFYNSGGANTASLTFRNNTLTNVTYTGTGSGTMYWTYLSSAVLSLTETDNSYNNLTIKNSGTWYVSYHPVTYPANATITWARNQYYNITRGTGTGTTYCHYFSGSSPGSVTYNVYNNSFHDINNNVGSWYNYYNLDYSSSPYPVKSYHDNTIYNETNNASSYCFYLPGLGSLTARSTIYNNTCYNMTQTSTVYGIYASNTTSQLGYDIYNNKFYNITTTSGTMYMLYPGSGYGTVNCYRNLVANCGATTTGTVYGMYFPGATSVGSTFNFYNNILGHLYTAGSTSVTGMIGMYIAGGTAVNLYNNTVYLDYNNTSTTTAGSSLVYVSTTTPNVTMRNNILYSRVNSTAASGGQFTVFRYTSAPSTGAYTTNSNNNCFYSSGASTLKPIYCEGTSTTTYVNTKTTMTDYKAYMAGRDQSSVSEDVSSLVLSTTATSSNYLHLITTVPTQLESGASSTGLTSLFTTDYDGNPRPGNPSYAGTGTAWDMGAAEFNGMPADYTAPSINHTALGTTCSTGDRTLTANITDGTGISLATAANWPMVYYKKGVNGTYVGSSGSLTSGTSGNGNWSFTISAASLSGLNTFDTIYYFLVAQDSAATQNIGTLPSGGTATNVATITTPPSSPYSYVIGQSISGTLTVGSGQTYPTLSSAANAYNSSCIVGNVVFSLTDALYDRTTGESFPIDFKHNATVDANNYLTIRPAAGVTTKVRSGASNAIRIYGADYMVIDGSNNGSTSRDLTIHIDSTVTGSNTTVVLIGNSGLTGGNSTNNVVKNCYIYGPCTGTAYTATGDYYWGVAIAGTAGGNNGADNDNNTIDNNFISHVGYAIAVKGTAGLSNGGDDNIIISNNILDSVYFRGPEIQNAVQPIIRNNDIRMHNNVATTLYAVYIMSTVDNAQIFSNKIHRLYNLYPSSYSIYVIYAPTASNSSRGHWIYNNAIYDVEVGYSIYGIYCYAPYSKIVNNSIRFEGTNNFYAGTNYFYNIYMPSTASSAMDVVNNIVSNTRYKTGYTVYDYLVYSYIPYNFTNGGSFDYNIYWYNSVNAATSYVYDAWNGVYYTTIAALKGAPTGLATGFNNDHSSFSDPYYNPLPSFYCDPSSFAKNGGKLYTSTALNITTDIDGNARTASKHSIGASETFVDVMPPNFANQSFPNQFVTTNPTNSNVTITDASGVQVGTADAPRLFYKKSSDANAYNGNTSSDNGWKFVYASNAANPYSFTMDYSLLYSSASVSVYDTIQYFYVAQDSIGNAGTNTGVTLNSRVTSAGSISSGHFPASGYASFVIVNPPLHGVYTIGTGGNYASIDSALTDATVRGVDGATAFELIDAVYNTSNTTFPITVGTINGASNANTITLRPASGNSPIIGWTPTSGNSIFKFNGTDYFIIDGSNNGTSTRNLYITDSTATTVSAVLWFASQGTGAGCTHNIVRNVHMQAYEHPGASTATIFGIYSATNSSITTSSGGSDNDYNTYENNWIHGVNYGIYVYGNSGAGTTDSLRLINNMIGSDFDSLGSYGIYTYYVTQATIKGNTVKNIITSTVNIGAIDIETGCQYFDIVGNDVGPLKYYSTGGWGIYGIKCATGLDNSAFNIVNNTVHELISDGYTNTVVTDNSHGIFLYSTGGGYNVYFNTVSYSGSYAGYTGSSTFNSCLEVSTTTSATTTPLNIKNNILFNDFNNTSITTDNSYTIHVTNANTQWLGTCDYNNYYLGSNAMAAQGGTSLPIAYYNGAGLNALADIRTAWGQDAHSLSVNPQLNSSSIMAPNLGSPILNVGTPIAAFGSDILGVTRSATAPSLGAYEYGQKLSAPTISFTPLVNQSNLTNGGIALTATITDPLGVDSINFKPRMYFKKRSDANTFVGNTSFDNGWKYVETSSSSSPYSPHSFVFDWSLLRSSVSVGDTIQYFVTAQDVFSTPNAGVKNGTLSTKATSVQLTASNFPITGTDQFIFVGPPMSGVYTVGVGQNYTHIVDAVNDLKLRGVNGPTTFSLTDALYNGTTGESFPIVITEFAGASATNRLTISPAAGVTTTITTANTCIFKIDGADYVTIDGSNNGSTSRDMTIYNSLATTYVTTVWIASRGAGQFGANSGAAYNTVKNCILTLAQNNTYNYGLAVSGSTYMYNTGSDNDYTTIENNMITKAGYGLYVYSSSTNNTDNLIVRNNDLGRDTMAYAYGMYLYYVNGATVTGNTIRNLYYASNPYAIYAYYDSGLVINNNNIHTIVANGTGGYGGKAIYMYYSQVGADHIISNNVIYDLRGDGYPITSVPTDVPCGIVFYYTQGNVKAYHNSINLYGTMATTWTAQYSACISVQTGVAGLLDIRNNVLMNTFDWPTTTTDWNVCIANLLSSSSVFSNLDYNVYYAAGPQNYIGLVGSGTSTVNSLAALQASTSFGGNLHSVVANPNFNANDNLVPQPNSPAVGLGTPFSSVPTDFLGVTRSTTAPTAGAYENAIDVVGPTITFATLANTGFTSGRILNATITDATGVPNSGGSDMPNLFWKLGRNGSWVQSQSTYSGNNVYQFSFGSGVNTYDTVYYYLVAQDVIGNVSVSNPTTGAAGYVSYPTSSTGPMVTTAPTSPLSYVILPAVAGTFYIGQGQTWTSLTKAGGFFQYLQSVAVIGDITAVLTSDMDENNAYSLNAFDNTYNLYIVPDGPVVRTMRWVNTQNGPMIVVNGASNVYFDGRYNGAGRYLRFVTHNTTTATTGACLRFANSSYNCEVRNCIFEGNSSANPQLNIFSNGTSSNIRIYGNLFKDTLGYAATPQLPYQAIYVYSNNNNIKIGSTNTGDGNEFMNHTNAAIYLPTNADTSMEIAGNSFYRTYANTTGGSAINMTGASSNTLIHDNSIGGSDASRGGAVYNYSGSTLTMMNITATGTKPVRIYNNTFANIGTTAAIGLNLISVTGATKAMIYNNVIGGGATASDTIRNGYDNGFISSSSTDTVDIYGNTISNAAYYGGSGDRTSCIYVSGGYYRIYNNTINNVRSNASSTSLTSSYGLFGIYVTSTTIAPNASTANLIYGNTISNNVQTNTGSGSYINIGINLSSANANVYKNKVYGLSASGSGTTVGAPQIVGIFTQGSGNDNVYNNMISLSSTTPRQFRGIESQTSGTMNVYHNTIYIGGSTNTSTKSYGFFRSVSSPSALTVTNFKNNLVYLDRTASTAVNFAVANLYNSFWTGYTNISNNVYVADSATKAIAEWTGTAKNLASWASSSGETSSNAYNRSVFTSSVFANATNGDLTQAACYANNVGTPVAMVTADMNGNARSNSTPDVGANEYTPVAPAAPVLNAATGVGTTQFTTSWSPVTNAVKYTYDLSTSNAFASFVSGYNGRVTTATSMVDTGLQVATTYYYRVKATDGGGCSSSYASGSQGTTSNATLDIVAFFEGFYLGGSTMQAVVDNSTTQTGTSTVTDTVSVELWDANNTSAPYKTARGLISTSGAATFSIDGSVIGNSYYIRLVSRNHIATWSAAPVTFGATTSYNFSSSDAQAYGYNLRSDGNGVYMVYTGDINQDGSITNDDAVMLDNDNANFAFGYLATDLTGDASVTNDDAVLLDNNNSAFIGEQRPF